MMHPRLWILVSSALAGALTNDSLNEFSIGDIASDIKPFASSNICDFQGKWHLILDKSDSLDSILTGMQFGWLKKKALRNFAPTTYIRFSDRSCYANDENHEAAMQVIDEFLPDLTGNSVIEDLEPLEVIDPSDSLPINVDELEASMIFGEAPVLMDDSEAADALLTIVPDGEGAADFDGHYSEFRESQDTFAGSTTDRELAAAKAKLSDSAEKSGDNDSVGLTESTSNEADDVLDGQKVTVLKAHTAAAANALSTGDRKSLYMYMKTLFPWHNVKEGVVAVDGPAFAHHDSDTGVWQSAVTIRDGRLYQKRVSEEYGTMYDIRAVFKPPFPIKLGLNSAEEASGDGQTTTGASVVGDAEDNSAVENSGAGGHASEGSHLLDLTTWTGTKDLMLFKWTLIAPDGQVYHSVRWNEKVTFDPNDSEDLES